MTSLEEIVSQGDYFEPIAAYELAKAAKSASEVAEIIRRHKLVRECVPTEYLDDPKVWHELLLDMPITATLRNLAAMTANGTLTPLSDASQIVCNRLRSEETLRKGRVHPMAMLLALKVYESGKGIRGSKTWTPVPTILNALDEAYYKCFQNVVPTGKRWLYALDVSGSMGVQNCLGVPITPREASAALSLVLAATEPQHHIVCFSGDCRNVESTNIRPLDISPRMRLSDAVSKISGLPFGATDCALPMIYAAKNKIPVDVFVQITDNETYAGSIHPTQALQEYRRVMNIDAKLAVLATTATSFTIADPKDAHQIDISGFSADVPNVLSTFATM